MYMMNYQMLKRISWISTLNLKLKGYDQNGWFTEEELGDLPPIEDDEEEVKEEKGLKFSTPSKLLTSLPILLAQKKSGYNSYKLKNEISQILYLLYQYNKIIKKFFNNLIKSF